MALSDNLVEYWKLDNSLSGALSSINLGQVGTSAGYETGKINNGIRYDGTANVHNEIAHTTALGAGTVNLWFYRVGDSSSGSYWRLFAKTQVSVIDVFGIFANSQGKRLSVAMNNAGIYNAGSDQFSTSTWHMITVTWDGSNIKSYIDGSLVNDTSSSLTVVSNSTPYTVGGWQGNNSQQANARIDEVGIWSRALTSGEVTSLYNSGSGNQYPFSGGSTFASRMSLLGVGR